MKTMTCRQLGGACDKAFHAETFQEMGEQSKRHAAEMAALGDKDHIDKMNEMMELMKTATAVQAWFEKVQKEFDDLPEDI